MKKTAWWKIAVIAVLGIAVIGVMQLKAKESLREQGDQNIVATATSGQESPDPTAAPPVDSTAMSSTNDAPATPPSKASTTTADLQSPKAATAKDTPKTADTATPPPVRAMPEKKATFIELGADQCIPCKMMQPIMDELRQEYPDTLKVVFYDVWKDPQIAEKYGVRGIPTQVLLDGDGKEIFRHVGFWPKDDIVAKFKELGINL